MMAVFSIGIGASAILSGLAETPVPDRTDPDSRRRLCRDLLPGRVVEGRSKTGMVLSANEVFGNLGVAVAALLTNYLIDTVGWRSAYFVPGAFSVLIGIGYMLFIRALIVQV